MTPKEKAKELFNQIYKVEDVNGDYPMCIETAKQCAKIAVEEIIILLSFASDLNMLYRSELVVFWNEVLKEIDNL